MGKDLNGKDIGRGFSQRPDGRYEARATVKGKKIDIYSMSLTELRKTFEIEKAKLLRDERGVRPHLTLGSWYIEWFEKCKTAQLKSEISRSVYNRKAKNTYIRLLGDKRIEEITQINIQEATSQLVDNEGYTPRTVREALGAIRECFDVAVANKIVYTNPVRGISIREGHESAKNRRVLDHWEQELLLEETETSYYREPYRILLLTGMRIGEFSGLKWSDIDFNRKVIHVSRSMMTGYVNGKKILELTTPKTSNSYRDIPFFGDIANLLRTWRDKQSFYKEKMGERWRSSGSFEDLVFTTTLGSPITRYNIIHDMKRVEENIRLKESTRAYMEGRQAREFEHIHPHVFRHTFATRLFEKGVDPLVVQSIMGHSNYSTTISYTHILDNKTEEAVKKVGDLLA